MGGLHRPFMPRKPLDALQGPDAGEQLPGRTCSSRRLPRGERGVWGGAPGSDPARAPSQTIAVREHQNIKSGDHTHIQVIDLAVTEIVFQQVAQVHFVASGDTMEPRGQGFAFLGCRMQRPARRGLHIDSRSNWRRRSLGPV